MYGGTGCCRRNFSPPRWPPRSRNHNLCSASVISRRNIFAAPRVRLGSGGLVLLDITEPSSGAARHLLPKGEGTDFKLSLAGHQFKTPAPTFPSDSCRPARAAPTAGCGG